MSEVSTRHRVRKIKAAPVLQETPAVLAIAATAAATLLTVAAKAVFDELVKSVKSPQLSELRPGSELRVELKSAEARAEKVLSATALQPEEAAKVKALATLAVTPYRVSLTSCEMQSELTKITACPSPGSVQQAANDILAILESSHQDHFVISLANCWIRAAKGTGFDRIQEKNVSIGLIRLTAEDAAGRALVTEISTNRSLETRIETEVVGIRDGRCKEILDRFDKALEEEGVESDVPQRKPTGGACILDVARKFVSERTTSNQKSTAYRGIANTRKLRQRQLRIQQRG
ncbi:hypothetical protein L0156_10315 [bacterium]|nr:hypothetical protein [bacterium]